MDPMTEETGLPASVETAWGLRERPSKGPKPGLSLDRIVAAAVKVAAAEGLAAVSMGRVAGELGASAMSLYRYVASKDELLALMVDAAVGPPPPASQPGEDWRARPVALGLVLLPGAGPASVGRARADRRAAHHAQRRRLDGGGPRLARRDRSRRGREAVRDPAAERLRPQRGDADGGRGRGRRGVGRGERLGGMEPPDHAPDRRAERFPALHRALDSGALDEVDDPDEDFGWRLERLLDGVDVLVRGRG